MTADWTALVREVQALAQTGLAFTADPFDRERYGKLQDLAARMMVEISNLSSRDLIAGSSSKSVPDPVVKPRDDSLEQMIREIYAREEGYATPKVGVRGACFRGDKILMVRGTIDGLWTVPCGYADVNDLPSHAAEKEVREESGYLAKATKMAAVWDYRRHNYPPHPFHHYELWFMCELTGGAPASSIETHECGFFDESDLPPLSTTRTTAAQVARMFAHHREPTLPTEFD